MNHAPLVVAICRDRGWPKPEMEQQLIPGRKFRCDFVWYPERVVLEIQGGVFISGRHSRGMGQVKDMEKLNLIALAGFRVLQCTPRQISDGTLSRLLAEVFSADVCTATAGTP